MRNNTLKGQVIAHAIEILEDNINGVRYSELVQQIQNKYSHIKKSTIQNTIVNLEVDMPDQIYKVEQGLFRLVKFRESKSSEPINKDVKKREEAFYKPFAEYLINELEECTKAIPLGGNRFKDKWGTPDVIGVMEPRRSDIIKFPLEIISAEVKIDDNSLITAFGQACSYKLFSHKSYIVVPKSSQQDDISRVDALCRLFGIGLILFNPKDKENPNFEIRVRAVKNVPDMFHVNKYIRTIEDDLFSSR